MVCQRILPVFFLLLGAGFGVAHIEDKDCYRITLRATVKHQDKFPSFSVVSHSLPGETSRCKTHDKDLRWSSKLATSGKTENTTVIFIYGQTSEATRLLRSYLPSRPGLVFSDVQEQEKRAFKGTATAAPSDYVTIFVPFGIRHLVFSGHFATSLVPTTTMYSPSIPLQKIDLEVPESRFFSLQQSRRVNTSLSHQVVGDGNQFTIVFISGGYLAEEQEIFNQDVERAMAGLRGGGFPAWSAEPWSRYFHLMNFHSVFEPSVETGATVLTDNDASCTLNGTTEQTTLQNPLTDAPHCPEVAKNNNLRCSYGFPTFSRLACSSDEMLSLASNSHEADVVVAIVNDKYYGGTGYRMSDGKGLLTVYNGADMERLLVHELGHAAIGLADEYDYGFSEDQDWDLPNCQREGSFTGSLVKWDKWIGAGKVDNPADSLGCTFSNFVRPTDDQCLMRNVHNYGLCSVCKEETILQLFKGNMKLDTPRCPPDGYEIFLTGNEQATLTMNHFFALNQNISLIWDLPGGEPITGIPAIVFRGAQMTNPSTVVVRANLTDNTDMVLQEDGWPKFVSSEFYFRRDESNRPIDCKPLTCVSTNNQVHQYQCARCVKQGGCDPVSTLLTPYDAVDPESITIDQARSVVSAVAICLAVFGVVVIVAAAAFIFWQRSTSAQEVLVIEGTDFASQVVCLILGVVCFVLSVVFLVLDVYYLPRVAIFGASWVVAGLVFTGLVYLGSIFVIIGCFARKEVLLLTGGPLLLGLMSIALIAIAAYGIYLYDNVNSVAMIDQFRSAWLNNAQNNPGRVCSLQKALTCSGFDHSCVPTPSSYCPKNCDRGNTAPNACLTAWQDFVSDTAYPLAILAAVSAFIMLATVTFAAIFYLKLRRLRATAKGRRSYRRDERAPVAAATKAEINLLEKEFYKADKDGNGKLDPNEIVEFLQATLGETTTAEDEQLLVKAAQDGDLDFPRVLSLYFPTFDQEVDPRMLTQEEAEEAVDTADLQRLQYTKHQEYMKAAGALSPEDLRRLHQKHTSIGSASTDFFELIQKEARAFEDTEEAEMCKGLTPHELEGLRCSWAALHPEIEGPLTDSELDRLFQWTHGQAFVSQEHFLRWRDMLDVRKRGAIGWPEFCFPFTKRSLLRKARRELESAGRVCEPEMKTFEEVVEEFGEGLAEQVFLRYEPEVPVERVLVLSLRPHYSPE